MVNKKNQGLRYNENKLRYDLFNEDALRDLAKVLYNGANKYSPRNWEKGMSWSTIIQSFKRHLTAIEAGIDYDDEDQLLHVAHLQANAHFLNAYYYIFPEGDDRPKHHQFLDKKIGLDIDDVLADFTLAWHLKYGTPTNPLSWWFDYKMKNRFDEMKKNGELEEFYLNIPPLIKPEDIPFDPVCYITSRPVKKEITEQWIIKNNFPQVPVFSIDIETSKIKVAKEANIDIFIDDHYDNWMDLNKNGITTYLFTQSYNKKFNVGHLRINKLSDLPFLKYKKE